MCLLIEKMPLLSLSRIQVQRVTNRVLLLLSVNSHITFISDGIGKKRRNELPVEETEFPKVVKHTRALFPTKATTTEVKKQRKPEQKD